jgi:predicted transcriptional regulator
MNNPVFEQIIEELALLAAERFITATKREGKTTDEAMREIVRTILETYREAIAQ